MCRSWRLSSGCGIGGERLRQEQSRGEAVVPEEDEAGRCQGDLFAIPKNFRDLSVNLNFSLLQRSNEKMLNMKVVEFFKLYNIVLGFRFRNSKFTTL
jgi:hypothetical protein